jgi:hypothetical protein
VSGDVPPFNREAFLHRVRGDLELASALAALFLEHLPAQLDDVRRAVEAGDAAAIDRTTHALKGSVANFDAEPARMAAQRLEVLGRTGDLTEAVAALRTLERELDRLGPALRELTG